MKFIAVRDHTSRFPDPVCFEPGDVLTLGRRDEEYPGWIWIRDREGREGWAPESYIRAESPRRGRAVESYTARELDTRAGDRLVSSFELAGWSWVHNEKGEAGWVPRDILSPSD